MFYNFINQCITEYVSFKFYFNKKKKCEIIFKTSKYKLNCINNEKNILRKLSRLGHLYIQEYTHKTTNIIV